MLKAFLVCTGMKCSANFSEKFCTGNKKVKACMYKNISIGKVKNISNALLVEMARVELLK